ncbi:MAG TPA: AAA family ATPase [Acidobacteriaceae bacterium]|nr:AAA family ATPase [Acidobacteriaceae bacterium]
MKILELVAENFKKIRVVEIRPDGNVVKLTGKNGQGKSSVLDALWFVLKGKAALPKSAVRKGAEKLRVKADFGEFTVTRTCTDGGLPTINIEMAKGKTRDTTPQEFLDKIIGTLTFDPLEFVRMDTDAKVEMLRQVAGVDSEAIEKLNAANETDYTARTDVNREARELKAQMNGMTVIEGLPKAKIDEQAILKKLNEAGDLNRKAQEVFITKERLAAKAASAQRAIDDNEALIAEQDERVRSLEQQLEQQKKTRKAAQDVRKSLDMSAGEAITAHKNAPSGEPIDVTALTQELQAAQRTNRAMDARTQYDLLKARLESKEAESTKLTRAIDARDEKKRDMLANAKIPVDGLVFDESKVLYKGLPLENLGEGEQIRISTEIGMAANPKLRVLSIRHGEALDEDGLKMLAKMAKEHDFQIWMAKVDSSGKVGIVLEDGMVIARNGEE